MMSSFFAFVVQPFFCKKADLIQNISEENANFI